MLLFLETIGNKCKAMKQRRLVLALWTEVYSASSLDKEVKEHQWATLQKDLQDGRYDKELASCTHFKSCPPVMWGVERLQKGESSLEKMASKQAKREERTRQKQEEAMSNRVVEVEANVKKSEAQRQAEELQAASEMATLTQKSQNLPPFVFTDTDDLEALKLPPVDVMWFLDIQELIKNGQYYIQKFIGPTCMSHFLPRFLCINFNLFITALLVTMTDNMVDFAKLTTHVLQKFGLALMDTRYIHSGAIQSSKPNGRAAGQVAMMLFIGKESLKTKFEYNITDDEPDTDYVRVRHGTVSAAWKVCTLLLNRSTCFQLLKFILC